MNRQGPNQPRYVFTIRMWGEGIMVILSIMVNSYWPGTALMFLQLTQLIACFKTKQCYLKIFFKLPIFVFRWFYKRVIVYDFEKKNCLKFNKGAT